MYNIPFPGDVPCEHFVLFLHLLQLIMLLMMKCYDCMNENSLALHCTLFSWQVQNALDDDPNELDGIVPAINDLLHSFSTSYSLFYFKTTHLFCWNFYRFRPSTLFPVEFNRKSMWRLEQEWKSLNFQFVTSNEAINVGRKISNKYIRTEDFYGLGGQTAKSNAWEERPKNFILLDFRKRCDRKLSCQFSRFRFPFNLLRIANRTIAWSHMTCNY